MKKIILLSSLLLSFYTYASLPSKLFSRTHSEAHFLKHFIHLSSNAQKIWLLTPNLNHPQILQQLINAHQKNVNVLIFTEAMRNAYLTEGPLKELHTHGVPFEVIDFGHGKKDSNCLFQNNGTTTLLNSPKSLTTLDFQDFSSEFNHTNDPAKIAAIQEQIKYFCTIKKRKTNSF